MAVSSGISPHQASASAGRPRHRRIPPNLFGIPFGLAGLGDAWQAGGPVLGTPQAVPDAVYTLAGCLWLALVTQYAAQGPRRMLADLRDPLLGPFVSLSAITPMILAAALGTAAETAGRVLVIVFLAVTVALGGWLTGQWIAGDPDPDSAHPGYFLPTVAGGLVGAAMAARLHLHALAEASFGIGVVCWLLLGSVSLNRLFFRRPLPPALVPTLAIELAPPVVAGAAYFALTGGTVNFVASALGGYAVLMAVAQLRFIPLYARLRFSPGLWAVTFPSAAAATDALLWISATRPAGAGIYAAAVIALITALVAAIAARTVTAVTRGQLLPPSVGDTRTPGPRMTGPAAENQQRSAAGEDR